MRGGPRALVLSPTRELASQIADSFRVYGKQTGLTVATMYGGVPFRPQVNAMAAASTFSSPRPAASSIISSSAA